MIVKHIQRALLKKSNEHIQTLKSLGQAVGDEPLSGNVKVLEQSNQIKGMHTILHDKDTTREDFVFYFDRISTLLVERAMDHLDYTTIEVITKQDMPYKGCKLAGSGDV